MNVDQFYVLFIENKNYFACSKIKHHRYFSDITFNLDKIVRSLILFNFIFKEE